MGQCCRHERADEAIQDIKKEPGYSMIEVQREVHFFFMGDNPHKHTEQIRESITYLNCMLKDAGYVPDLSSW